MVTKTKKKEEVKSSVDKHVFTEFEETGCVGFDLALSDGKGIPEGSDILLFAMPGVGKSTVIADVLFRILSKYKAKGLPYRVHYLDSENSLTLLAKIGKDPKNPDSLGLEEFITVYEGEDDAFYKPQQLIYHPNIATFEEAEVVYDQSINKDDEPFNKDIKMIIVDSLTNLTSKTLMEAEVSKADYGSDAKERVRFYKKWFAKARHKGITGIFTSQVRQKQGATPYEDPNRPAVTEADKHNMDVIAKFTKITNSNRTELKKIKQNTIDGVIEWQDRYIINISTFKAPNTKNRIGRYPDVEILVQHGKKIVNAFTLYNMLEAHGDIKKENARTASISPELRAFLGDAVGDLPESAPLKEVRTLVSMNLGAVKEYLKLNKKYSALVGTVEETDDGLF